ncbi:MAG: hypothetical protein GX488_00740 [Clostridiales bacterium]|nr:hypothetical protein [Clostridiales bacterium]
MSEAFIGGGGNSVTFPKTASWVWAANGNYSRNFSYTIPDMTKRYYLVVTSGCNDSGYGAYYLLALNKGEVAQISSIENDKQHCYITFTVSGNVINFSGWMATGYSTNYHILTIPIDD